MAGAPLDQQARRVEAIPALRGLSSPERLMGLAGTLLAAAVLAIMVALIGFAGLRAEAMRDQNEARAARLAVYGLLQASIDAEYARTKASTAKTKKTVEEMRKNIEALRQEIERLSKK